MLKRKTTEEMLQQLPEKHRFKMNDVIFDNSTGKSLNVGIIDAGPIWRYVRNGEYPNFLYDCILVYVVTWYYRHGKAIIPFTNFFDAYSLEAVVDTVNQEETDEREIRWQKARIAMMEKLTTGEHEPLRDL